MNNWLIVFVAVTSVAVVIQMGILAGMFLTMRRSSARMEALAEEMKAKALPVMEKTHEMLTELRPQLNSVMGNITHSSNLLRGHMTRLDATVHDVLDRTRLQVIRADEMVSRTMDRVEETTEIVQDTVMSPVRQLSGLIHGVTVGLQFLMGGRRGNSRDAVGVPQDEMFI